MDRVRATGRKREFTPQARDYVGGDFSNLSEILKKTCECKGNDRQNNQLLKCHHSINASFLRGAILSQASSSSSSVRIAANNSESQSHRGEQGTLLIRRKSTV